MKTCLHNKITLNTYCILGTFVILSAIPANALERPSNATPKTTGETKPILINATPDQSQPVDIKPSWQVGKKFTQTLTKEETMTMTLGAQKMEQKSMLTTEYTLAIRAHENGKYKRVSMSYDRIAVEMNMAGQKVAYDSAKAGEKDTSSNTKAVRLLIGRELKMVVDDKGDVSEVENLDGLLDEPVDASPGSPMLLQVFSKDAIKNMVRQSSLLGTPGKPVEIEDSWPFRYSVSMSPSERLFIDGNYTMKGQSERAGGKCVELGLSAGIAITLAPVGGTADPAIEGTLTGSAWFDPALGICRDLETTQVMILQKKNPAKPGEMMEFPLKQVVKQTITKVENL